MNIEVLKLLITLINLCIVPFLNGGITDLVDSQKKRKLKILLESRELTEGLGDNFKANFIDPSIKEILFYLQTGISTNAKSIPRFIELKDKLGRNFTWKKIKVIQSHVNLKASGPLLQLNKAQKYTHTVTLSLLIAVIVISILELLAIYFLMDNLKPKEYLTLYLYVIIPLLAVMLLTSQTDSISKVKFMIRVLEEQDQNNINSENLGILPVENNN